MLRCLILSMLFVLPFPLRAVPADSLSLVWLQNMSERICRSGAPGDTLNMGYVRLLQQKADVYAARGEYAKAFAIERRASVLRDSLRLQADERRVYEQAFAKHMQGHDDRLGGGYERLALYRLVALCLVAGLCAVAGVWMLLYYRRRMQRKQAAAADLAVSCWKQTLEKSVGGVRY